MKTLILSNSNGVNVHFKTDILTESVSEIGNFTILEITDLTDVDKHHGLDLKQLNYNIVDLKALAEAHSLELSFSTNVGTTSIVDYTDQSVSMIDESESI